MSKKADLEHIRDRLAALAVLAGVVQIRRQVPTRPDVGDVL